MGHDDLITTISERTGLSLQTVTDVVALVGSIWAEELLTRGVLRLDGIGEFLVDHVAARQRLNVDTQEVVVTPPGDRVLFYPAPDLLEGRGGV